MTDAQHLGSTSDAQHSDDCCQRYLRAWNGNSPPDIRLFLSEVASEDSVKILKLDMENRWKRFSQYDDRALVDEHGFKMFPILEDYAALGNVNRNRMITPAMIVDEYRIRTQWGDRPDFNIYLSRFPHLRNELEEALGRIETNAKSGLKGEPEAEVDSFELQSTADYRKAQLHADDSVTDESKPPRQIDRYKLVSLIGRGGFGEVWKAYDPKLTRHVAIKFPRRDKEFSPEVLADFEKEGQKLAKLERIPGIVAVYDAGKHDGRGYIVSELIDGESLAARHKRSPKLSQQEIVRIISTVAEALHRAHLKDLVHRDIKPGNILLDNDGEPVVADFGLAVTESEQLAETHSVVGTISYMPPEQVVGKSHQANAQADIYSLGVVLYRLLTDRLPFVANTREEWREQILNRPPRSPRTIDDTIPEALERICLRCLEKRPEDRYSTARDLAYDLRRAMRHRRPSVAFQIFAVGIVVALMGILIVFGISRWNRPSPGPNANSKDVAQMPRKIDRANLLDKPPVKLVWEASIDQNSHGYSSNRFLVNTVGDAVFHFGQPHSKQFTYRVRFRFKKERGSLGLIWGFGLKESKTESQTKANAMVVGIRDGFFELTPMRFTFADFPQKRIWRRSFLQKIGRLPLEKGIVDFQIEISDGLLRCVTLQGKTLEKIKSPLSRYEYGDLGLFLIDGEFDITEAWYHNKEN